MKLFKLTDGHGCTMGQTQWGEGVKHSVAVDLAAAEPELCSDTVIHAYRFLELGLLLNPVHANFRLDGKGLRVWEAEGDVVVESWNKVGCRELTTIKEIPVPEWYWNISLRQHVLDHLCDSVRKSRTAKERYFGGIHTVNTLHTVRAFHHTLGLSAERLQHYAERAVAEVMRERHLY